MNEKLQEQLAIIVEKAILLAEQTGNFVIEQAPLLIQEFLLWNLMENAFWMVVFLLLIIIIYATTLKTVGKSESIDFYNKKFLGRYYDFDEPEVLIPVLGLVVSMILFFAGFVPHLLTVLKIIIAPKLYLIEYFVK